MLSLPYIWHMQKKNSTKSVQTITVRRPKKRIPVARKPSRVMSDKSAYNRQKERVKLKKKLTGDDE
ncbi:MAG: hypothetical protein FMNOHCHN_01460 [Ignavibacteriaceae bacterium]|nr:hypothetical protein [Ignavibacteriaceae bacterium]